jgi:protein FrlC
MMKLGIVTSVYNNYPLLEAIHHIIAAGYDAVDIWGGRPHAYRHDFAPQELKQLRQLIEDHGLAVSSFLPAFYRYPHNLCSPNDVVRRDTVEYVCESADNAVALGAGVLLVCPARILHGQTAQDAWERLVDSTDQVCEYTRPLNIRVALEAVNHHTFDLINTAADAVRMVEQLGHAHLGVLLDTGHMNLEVEPMERALQTAGGHLLRVHVNDNDGRHQQNLIPGDGSFPFDRFLRVLEANGYDGFVSAELSAEYGPDPDPAVRQTMQRLRQMLHANEVA